jgi:fructose-specific phosphotransferase system IIA component|tara:strand:- start:383 stop:844 length:462 start_codon:yes stop_codon:yes gene_type:complete
VNLHAFLSEPLVDLNLTAGSKVEAIEALVDLLVKENKVLDRKSYLDLVLERERMGSTGIGKGIAIPHGKTDAIKSVAIAFGRSKQGIDFDSLDDQPVKLIFLLAAPNDAGPIYLKALARLSRILRKEDFRQSLLKAKKEKAVLDLIESIEETI